MATKNVNIDIIAKDKTQKAMQSATKGVNNLKNNVANSVQSQQKSFTALGGTIKTVLGGLVGLPIIAVPTSIGYGVAQNGKPALNSILSSCSQGIITVNIDNGFGAACATIRILNQINCK